jgi:chitinase
LKGDAATLIGEFQQFKATNPDLKILVSVGGAGQDPSDFSNASNDPNFAANCVADTVGMLGNSADGIDIDWEFPASSDGQNFTNLMLDLRTALPPGSVLTAAVGTGPTDNREAARNANIPFSSVLDVVDFFNVMTYGAYSTERTTFAAPLFASNIKPYGTYNGTVDSTITDLINSRGVPPNKLVLGIPFYGIGYPSVPIEGANFGLYEVPASTMAVPYNQIATQFNASTSIKLCDTGRPSDVMCPPSWGNPLYTPPTSGSQETWIYDSGSAFGFGPSVVTFDDRGSIAAKVKYAFGKQLRGVMIWELTQDTADHVLLNAIVKCMPKPGYSSDRSSISSVLRFQ